MIVILALLLGTIFIEIAETGRFTCSLASLVRARWAKISMIRPILSSTGIPQAACRFLS